VSACHRGRADFRIASSGRESREHSSYLVCSSSAERGKNGVRVASVITAWSVFKTELIHHGGALDDVELAILEWVSTGTTRVGCRALVMT
jgi:hypothetical protein